MNWPRTLWVSGLALSVVASGIGVVYVKYLTRERFVELQALRAERDRIDIEWGRLQIEEAALTSQVRMAEQARKRLAMRMPVLDDVLLLREDDVSSRQKD